MSKKEKKNVPQLRFPEFKGDWEISNVGSACEVKNNLRKPISLPERDLMQGSYPYYGPTGIIDYLNEYGIDGKFAMIGEDGDHFLKYKSWSQTQLVEGRFNANNHVHIISGTNKCLVEWFFVYFRHRNIIHSLTRQGAGRYKLNKASLVTLPITLPLIAEQEKIASFFGAVDRRLTQLRHKRELLQTYKRGVMQKIFSQKIRFKDAIGAEFPDWEETTLGQASIFFDNERIPLSSDERRLRQGIYPYYGASGIIDSVNDYIFNGSYILLAEDGANIITRSTPVAFMAEGKFWVNNHAHVIQAKGSNKFLVEYLESLRYEKYNTGTAQPKLNAEVCKMIQIKLPHLQEQEKIANFLTAIDRKIEAFSHQIDQTEKFKKGLLQKMFV